MNRLKSGSGPAKDAPKTGRGRTPRYGWIVLVLAVVGLILYLITDHGSHVLAALPYAGIIIVVVMHLSMHRGHTHGGTSPGAHIRGLSMRTNHAHEDSGQGDAKWHTPDVREAPFELAATEASSDAVDHLRLGLLLSGH